MDRAHAGYWRDIALAVALALGLSLAWALADWPALSTLQLPDTDDMVRLEQLRAWSAGQHFADLTQHRLGAGGVPMHWSRLPDLIPIAIIAVLTSLFDQPTAELAAVLVWPALLFMAALALTGSIARAMGVSGPTAIIVAALGYPAVTLFMPGRIDHHGLQLLLLLVVSRSLLGDGNWQKGAVAALATVLSLCIGIESAPLLALAGGLLILRWVLEGGKAAEQLAGYALVLPFSLGVAALMLRTDSWSYPACDGFGEQLWRAIQPSAFAPLALILAGRFLPNRNARLAAAAAVGAIAVALAISISPSCLRPYGAVDPVLARIWLTQVAEAQPLANAPLADAVGYAGLPLVGLGATIWMWARSRREEWMFLGALQAVSVLILLMQLRGAYPGAMLAAPALAALIEAARRRNILAVAAAWLASAGLFYPIMAQAVAPASKQGTAGCDIAFATTALRQQSRGRVAAPIDMGPYLLATAHDMPAAPYHRNAAGNLAVYRLMLAPVSDGASRARQLNVDYIVICPSAFVELGSPPAGSLLAELTAGRTPAWLARVARSPAGTAIYHVAWSTNAAATTNKSRGGAKWN